MTAVFAFEFESVDDEEAGVGGWEWRTDEAELEAAYTEALRWWEFDVDHQVFFYRFEFDGDPLADKEATGAWLEEQMWWGPVPRPAVRRVVVLGGKWPGGEARRLAAAAAALRASVDVRFRP